MTPSFGLLALLSALIAITFQHANALSCYTFELNHETDTTNAFRGLLNAITTASDNVTQDCTACTRSFSKSLTRKKLGLQAVNERWNCEKEIPCREQVMVSYINDGSSDTRVCTCCSDKCNDPWFCDETDTNAVKIKRLITSYKPIIDSKTTASDSFSCNAKTGTLQREEMKCRECTKSFQVVMSGSKTVINREEWQCTPATLGYRRPNVTTGEYASLAYVTGAINLDGSGIRLYCSCYANLCNDETFCNFQETLRPSSALYLSYSTRLLFFLIMAPPILLFVEG